MHCCLAAVRTTLGLTPSGRPSRPVPQLRVAHAAPSPPYPRGSTLVPFCGAPSSPDGDTPARRHVPPRNSRARGCFRCNVHRRAAVLRVRIGPLFSARARTGVCGAVTPVPHQNASTLIPALFWPAPHPLRWLAAFHSLRARHGASVSACGFDSHPGRCASSPARLL